MFYNFDQIECMYPLFQAVENCRCVQQDEEHHPEGDVFIHSVQVLNCALRESKDVDLILAAFLHDVGKSVMGHGHEQHSCNILRGHISEKTDWLIRNHMRFWYFILGDMRKQSKVKELSDSPWFHDLAMLCRWDKMGRRKNNIPSYSRTEIIQKLKSLSLSF